MLRTSCSPGTPAAWTALSPVSGPPACRWKTTGSPDGACTLLAHQLPRDVPIQPREIWALADRASIGKGCTLSHRPSPISTRRMHTWSGAGALRPHWSKPRACRSTSAGTRTVSIGSGSTGGVKRHKMHEKQDCPSSVSRVRSSTDCTKIQLRNTSLSTTISQSVAWATVQMRTVPASLRSLNLVGVSMEPRRRGRPSRLKPKSRHGRLCHRQSPRKCRQNPPKKTKVFKVPLSRTPPQRSSLEVVSLAIVNGVTKVLMALVHSKALIALVHSHTKVVIASLVAAVILLVVLDHQSAEAKPTERWIQCEKSRGNVAGTHVRIASMNSGAQE